MPETFPVWGTRQGPCPSVQGVSMPRVPAMPDLDGGAGQGEAGGSQNTPSSQNSPVPKLLSVRKTSPDALAAQPVLLPEFLWEFTNHSQFLKHPRLPVWLLQLPIPAVAKPAPVPRTPTVPTVGSFNS